MTEVFIAWGLVFAFWAIVLLAYWVISEIQDRFHARRTVAAFDAFVARLDEK